MHRDQSRAFGHLYQRGAVWWLRIRVDGTEYRESSGSTSRRKAEQLLGKRAAELTRGDYLAVAARRTTFEDLHALVAADYRAQGYRSLARLEQLYRHLAAAFTGMRAGAITAERLVTYRDDRLTAGAAPATVDLELRALARGFRLARKLRRVGSVPEFPELEGAVVRQGFFEREDFEAVLRELPDYLRPPLTFAYYGGWRISEVLGLTWNRVDLAAGVVRLDVGSTKSGAGRTCPFSVLPPLQALFDAQRAATAALERRTGRLIPWVFWHRDGAPIRDFRRTWRSACSRAAHRGSGPVRQLVRPALLDRIVHDLRRTAVRNLVRAGVPEKTAMLLTGHKTRTVFDRYDIVNEADLRAGLAKLAATLPAAGAQSGAQRPPHARATRTGGAR